jgi:dihydrodipicolinate synthase/N-acetylneuraminate lyase
MSSFDAILAARKERRLERTVRVNHRSVMHQIWRIEFAKRELECQRTYQAILNPTCRLYYTAWVAMKKAVEERDSLIYPKPVPPMKPLMDESDRPDRLRRAKLRAA